MQNNKIKSLILSLLLLFTMQAIQADVAAVKAGIATWQQDPGGSLRWQGSDADLESGFQLDDDSQGFAWVKIEHPMPGLPNIGLMRTNIETAGTGTVSSQFTFGGVTFNENDQINSHLSLDHTDLILYYELVDVVKMQFDLGIMLRYIDGSARATNESSGQSESVQFDGVIPMLYVNVSAGLPFTGFSVGLEGSAIGYSGHSLSDIRAKVAYRTKAGVGLELGYRREELKLDDLDGFNSDLNFSGSYFSVFAKF